MKRLILIVALLLIVGLQSAFAQTCPLCAAAPTDVEMLTYAAPVERVLPNEAMLALRDYRQVIGAVDIRDTPNGNVIESRPEGTYFVTVRRWQDGWAEINENQWIPASQLQAAPISHLGGVKLKETLRYPLAWLLVNRIPSRYPGIEADLNDTPLARYALVNVFAQADIDGIVWAQIGLNQWVQQDEIAVVNPIVRPADVDTQRWVGVDLEQQVLVAYEGAQPMFAALVATGLDASPTTPGLFHVFFRTHERAMSRGDINAPFYYYMEDVPYTMYFDGNHALHGAYWHDDFGQQRSHGCVNLSLTDAYWVYDFLSGEIDLDNPDDLWPVVYIYAAAA